MKLSLVVPCYNEEGNVEKFFSETNRVFENRVSDYEFVFVNDGSKDNTYKNLKHIYNDLNEKKNVQVVSFSRNFGKEAAIYAGLSKAKGDLICLIDADLQQRPEVVLEMLQKMNETEDCDCVTAYQEERIENSFISFLKSAFYKTINKFSDVDFVNGASDFRLMKRSVAEAVLEMSEYHRFSKGLFSYVGFSNEYIPYKAEERESGETKWGTKKLIKYALEGILAFSSLPLKLSSFLGTLSLIASFIYIVLTAFLAKPFPDTALTNFLILFMGGLILLCIGVTGQYLSKIYAEVKNRPVYILKEHLE